MNRIAFLVCACLAFLAACAPAPRRATPIAIAPDGRTLAVAAPENHACMDLVDLQTGAITAKKLPWPYRAAETLDSEAVQWLGRDLAVSVNSGGSVDTVCLLDPRANGGRFRHLDTLSAIWYPWFAGTFEKQPAVFISTYTTEILSLPEFKPLGRLDYPVRGLRDGWTLRYHRPPGSKLGLSSMGWVVLPDPDGALPGSQKMHPSPAAAIQSTAIDILRPDQEVQATIDAAALKTAFPMGIRDAEGQLSPDHRRLLLAPESHGPWIGNRRGEIFPVYPWGWAVFDAATGQYLYGEKQDVTIVSRLALANDGVYCIAWATTQSPALPLPSEPLGTARPANHFFLYQNAGTVISTPLQLPVAAPGPDFQGPLAPFTTAMAPEGDFMVLYSLDPSPHLLKIPLRREVRVQDLGTVPLQAAKP